MVRHAKRVRGRASERALKSVYRNSGHGFSGYYKPPPVAAFVRGFVATMKKVESIIDRTKKDIDMMSFNFCSSGFSGAFVVSFVCKDNLKQDWQKWRREGEAG